MLCISRNPLQKFVVGEATIEILAVSRTGKVRLGITAPKSVEIWRTELLGEDGQPREPRQPKEPALALKGGLE